MIAATIITLALMAQASAPAELRFCGSRDRDIGRGFTLTQYMFDGASDFSLTYRPPAQRVRTAGVTQTGSFHFIFSQMAFEPEAVARKGFVGPQVGFGQYRFIKPDGLHLGVGVPRLACGGGIVMTNDFSKSGPPPSDVPVTFFSPFFAQDQKGCIAQLSRDGRYRFTVTEQAGAPPAVVIEDRIDLKWALAKAERFWRSDLQAARKGACRLAAPPPRHAPLPPPPPPILAPPSSADPGSAGLARPNPSRGGSGR